MTSKRAREICVGDFVSGKQVKQVRRSATSGGCRVTIWVEGSFYPLGTYRGSQKLTVVENPQP